MLTGEESAGKFASVMGAVTDRFNTQFLIACWLPAFMATPGGLGRLIFRLGLHLPGADLDTLDSVQRALLFVVVALVVTMLAFVLRSLRLPITTSARGRRCPDHSSRS